MNALLFPGQGAQYAGLLAKANRIDGAGELFARASAVLGRDVSTADDDAALGRTDVVQLNTFLASIATALNLRSTGIAIGAVAGHSVGAFAAAVFSGALEFEDAVRLVELRGRLMGRLFPTGFAMGAIVGCDQAAVERIIAAFDEVYVAAINARDQITIVGRRAQVLLAFEAARDVGARTAKLLNVTVPSHSPLMIPVRDALAEALSAVCVRRPSVVYAANMDGRAKLEGREIAADLIESVARPVRWRDAMQMLVERGVRSFIETSPGDTLTTILNAMHVGAQAVALDRVGPDDAAYWLRVRDARSSL